MNGTYHEIVVKIEFPVPAESLGRMEDRVRRIVLEELARLDIPATSGFETLRWPGGGTSGFVVRRNNE